MPSASTFKAINYVVAFAIAVALCSPAMAAVSAPRHVDAAISRPTVTPIHWVWRHHHRFWVSDHHRY